MIPQEIFPITVIPQDYFDISVILSFQNGNYKIIRKDSSMEYVHMRSNS